MCCLALGQVGSGTALMLSVQAAQVPTSVPHRSAAARREDWQQPAGEALEQVFYR